MKGLKSVEQVINKIKELTEEKDNYAAALRELRSAANWKAGIDKDGRPAVKRIYAMYLEIEAEIRKLLDLEVNV